MRVAFHAVTMGDTPGLDRQPIAELDVASAVAVAEGDIATFDEAHIGDKADAAFFVGEVGPDDIVEDVRLDSVDGGREGGDFFGAGGVLEGGGVDGEAAEMVEVRVGDEVGGDEVAEEICGVGVGGFVGEDQAGEGAGVESESGLGSSVDRAWGAGSGSFGFGERGMVAAERFGGRTVI